MQTHKMMNKIVTPERPWRKFAYHTDTRPYQLCLFPIQHSFTFLLFSRRVANCKKKKKKKNEIFFFRVWDYPEKGNPSSRGLKNAREAH